MQLQLVAALPNLLRRLEACCERWMRSVKKNIPRIAFIRLSFGPDTVDGTGAMLLLSVDAWKDWMKEGTVSCVRLAENGEYEAPH